MIPSSRRIHRIATERIQILMENAEEVFPQERERAHRYARLAKRIATRHAMRFPREWKRRICKGCQRFLRPGANARVRLGRNGIVLTCQECGRRYRFPLTKEKKARRRARQRDRRGEDKDLKVSKEKEERAVP
jgi:ribonuclease P protein subunit RPR2